ncbi:MAG: hypothetical protein WBF75_12065 [Pseudonocardiaceae bacterium]
MRWLVRVRHVRLLANGGFGAVIGGGVADRPRVGAASPALANPGVRATLPSVAQAVRIFPAVERPIPARTARTAAVAEGWACRVAHSLSSATVRPAGGGVVSGTACSARVAVFGQTLWFLLGMTTSFHGERCRMGGRAPGGGVAPVRCRWIGLRVYGRFLHSGKSTPVEQRLPSCFPGRVRGTGDRSFPR